VLGLHYCHTKNICHRDIKLENLLVDDEEVDVDVPQRPRLKICDFGYSVNEKSYKPRSGVGTFRYRGMKMLHPRKRVTLQGMTGSEEERRETS
jgi:serine/threonine-protein kinase SRK2